MEGDGRAGCARHPLRDGHRGGRHRQEHALPLPRGGGVCAGTSCGAARHRPRPEDGGPAYRRDPGRGGAEPAGLCGHPRSGSGLAAPGGRGAKPRPQRCLKPPRGQQAGCYHAQRPHTGRSRSRAGDHPGSRVPGRELLQAAVLANLLRRSDRLRAGEGREPGVTLRPHGSHPCRSGSRREQHKVEVDCGAGLEERPPQSRSTLCARTTIASCRKVRSSSRR